MAVKGILLDTNGYVAFKRGVADAVSLLKRSPWIGVCSVVLGELLVGSLTGLRDTRELNQFLNDPQIKLLVVDAKTAEFYAHVYHNLKQKGRPIPTNDLWIAAAALQHQLALFSYDQHFSYVDGLTVGTSLQDFAFV
jgi:predicted nucleic acid-binding protein